MPLQTFICLFLSLLAFAGNSLLSRIGLKGGGIDAASFVCIRILSGALALWLVLRLKGRRPAGDWLSALCLLLYALPFTFAYVTLPAATGALLSFGAVQVTMICAGMLRGERFNARQWFGFGMAVAGILAFLLPHAAAPPLVASLLMVLGGIGWGLYSLRGRGAPDALNATAGNFLRAAPLCLLCCLPFLPWHHLWPLAHQTAVGAGHAVLSGVVTSALGYVLWYKALRHLNASTAATVQLSVPVIASLLGLLLLDEPLTTSFIVISAIVLGGIALVLLGKKAR